MCLLEEKQSLANKTDWVCLQNKLVELKINNVTVTRQKIKKKSLESFSLEDFWFPVDWVTFFGSGVVLFVNFDGLVGLCGDQSAF